jgi:hypothetical protein
VQEESWDAAGSALTDIKIEQIQRNKKHNVMAKSQHNILKSVGDNLLNMIKS